MQAVANQVALASPVDDFPASNRQARPPCDRSAFRSQNQRVGTEVSIICVVPGRNDKPLASLLAPGRAVLTRRLPISGLRSTIAATRLVREIGT